MKFQMAKADIEEMVFCIIDCNLTKEQAVEYVSEFIAECQQDVEDVD